MHTKLLRELCHDLNTKEYIKNHPVKKDIAFRFCLVALKDPNNILHISYKESRT